MSASDSHTLAPLLWKLASIALIGACVPAIAEVPETASPQITVGQVAAGAIKLDGVLDEPAWRNATVIPTLVQQDPHPGAPTPFTTRVLVLQSPDALYFGIIATDPDPAKLAVHSLDRDADAGNNTNVDDTITIVLDPFGDRKYGYVFAVNAGGARTDGLISPESNQPSWSWNGLWNARVRRTAHGYVAEIRIPARTLRFKLGLTRWGLNIERYVPRRQLTLTWSGHTLNSSVYDLQREGTLAGMAPFKPGLGLRITPYAIASYSDRPPGFDHKAGLTLTQTLTPGLTGALTLNPDFAEAEAESQQINLTPYPLFLPENREFFNEGSNVFTFATGLDESQNSFPFYPFYSRRVGLVNGNIVPIDAGAKVVGQTGPWTIGALDVQTRDTAAAPGTNLFAGRFAYALNDHLQLGTLVTHGDPTGATDNTFAGFDAIWRTSTFRGDKNLTLSAWRAQSWGNAVPGNHAGWGYRLDYPNDLWQFGFQYDDYGNGLDPALGFLSQPGTHQYFAYTEYRPRPTGGLFGWVRQFFFQAYPQYITDSAGRVESWQLFTAPFNAVANSGTHYEIDWTPMFQRLYAPFEISPGVVIPPGGYRFTRWSVESQSPPSQPLQVGAHVIFGGFYTGRLTHVHSFVDYSTPGGHWTLGLTAENDFGYLPQGNFIERLYGLQLNYAAAPDIILTTLTQYDTTSHRVESNDIFRWTIEPGRDLYVIFSHDVETLTNIATAGGLQSHGNQLLVKLSWTFQR